MALSSNNTILWSDIQEIYTKLNNCQTKFGITKTTAPSKPGAIKPEIMTNLKSFIFALKNSNYVGTTPVAPVFNLTNVTTGSPIQSTPFETMNSTLDTVYSRCAHDANFSDFSDFSNFSNFSDFSDFGFNSGNFGHNGNFGDRLVTYGTRAR